MPTFQQALRCSCAVASASNRLSRVMRDFANEPRLAAHGVEHGSLESSLDPAGRVTHSKMSRSTGSIPAGFPMKGRCVQGTVPTRQSQWS